MTTALERLKEEKIPFLLCGYSSLDRYFRLPENGPLYLAIDSSLVSLAKAFDHLQFPGLPLEDASVQSDGTRLVFRCVDSLSVPPSAPFTVLRLLYDPGRNAFIDRIDLYPDVAPVKSMFKSGRWTLDELLILMPTTLAAGLTNPAPPQPPAPPKAGP